MTADSLLNESAFFNESYEWFNDSLKTVAEPEISYSRYRQGRINARAYLGLSPGPRAEGGPRWCRKIL